MRERVNGSIPFRLSVAAPADSEAPSTRLRLDTKLPHPALPAMEPETAANGSAAAVSAAAAAATVGFFFARAHAVLRGCGRVPAAGAGYAALQAPVCSTICDACAPEAIRFAHPAAYHSPARMAKPP